MLMRMATFEEDYTGKNIRFTHDDGTEYSGRLSRQERFSDDEDDVWIDLPEGESIRLRLRRKTSLDLLD